MGSSGFGNGNTLGWLQAPFQPRERFDVGARREKSTSMFQLVVRERGFSLIELLIVVAIISILAGIAVPNFLEAQTRSKVSRVRADARSLSVAVESYMVDNNRYPHRQKFPTGSFGGLADLLTRLEDMSVMTTPIAYITTLPEDVFEKNIAPPRAVLDYYSPGLVAELSRKKDIDFGWMIVSVGPDGVFGQPGTQGHLPKPSANTHYNREYDPTNGSISLGNVTRFQRNGATADYAFNP